ncbi:MAG: branched-chain amino acid ABC transporter permease [Hyphomicrobiales bacterium]|nr:branched-chain amino acid ABC transporter permease [Hyphomicrobiales bacterium]
MASQELPGRDSSAVAPRAEAGGRERERIDHDASLGSFARRRHRKLAVAALTTVAIALLPLVIHDVYLQNIIVLTLMYAALSQSWNILGGYCGQISLGHAIYFGIGAYVSTLLFVHAGLTPWLGMLIGGVFAALVALALGYPFFRLRGHYFTIATIVVAETGLLLMLNWDFAGGAQGIQIPYGPDSWAHLQFARDKLPYVYFALGFALLTWLVTFLIEDSRWGYWWRAVKDNAEAAESLGVVVFRSKMAAAALSAFFTAIGGSFYAAFVSYIDPDSVMGFQLSLLIALPAVLGGIGTLWGPALGALVLIPLTELTRSYFGGSGNGLDLIIYGVLIMVIALARPEGLTSLFGRTRKARATPQARANPEARANP